MWNIEKIVKKGEYLYAIVRNHPNRTKNDYVLHHRIVMENHLNRILEEGEIIHHLDGNKHNNVIGNLEVMKLSDHSRLHAKENVQIFVKIKCPVCLKLGWVLREKTHIVNKKKFTTCSKPCFSIFLMKIEKEGMTSAIKESIAESVGEFKKVNKKKVGLKTSNRLSANTPM